MNKISKILPLVLALVLVLSACGKKPAQDPVTPPENEEQNQGEVQKDDENTGQEETNADKKIVVATTTFARDMVRVLLGDDVVDVRLIVPAGGDPHTYVATPEDRVNFDKADLILYHGLNFEAQMNEIFENSADRAVKLAKNFDEDELIYLDGEVDPHFWFDVDLYKKALVVAAEALTGLVPEKADDISANLEVYNGELDKIAAYATEKISEIPKESRYLITPHDAFSYFSREYDITVKAPQGVSTESETGVEDIASTVDFIVEHKVKAIFAESTTDPVRMDKLQESVKKQGHDVQVVKGDGNELLSDSLAAEGDAATYIGMVKHNVDLMYNNLK